MPEPLFKPGLAYPRDETGPYVEFEGVIAAMGEQHERGMWIDVYSPEHGRYAGWWGNKFRPEVGYRATIRIYDCGGNFYADSRIISWRRGDAAVLGT